MIAKPEARENRNLWGIKGDTMPARFIFGLNGGEIYETTKPR